MADREYIVSIPNDFSSVESKCYDVIVVGAGIAGMTVALSLDPKLKVALVSKERFIESSTYKAQGGMAVAVGSDDSIEQHIADTIRVGQGLCRKEAVDVLISEGPTALEFLQSLGASFHHNEKGLVLTREAGHSRNRVVHYYDYTGKYIAEVLAGETSKRGNIDRLENAFLVDILTAAGQCCGCVIERAGQLVYLRSAAVVVATGGYSGLFARATNAISASGDGIAAAYRAGAIIGDMEFVQFHPTAVTTLSGKVFLLTEALRGEGAKLINSAGERFMFSYHPSGELAPRDVVSRAILRETQKRGGSIYLDARHLGKEYLMNRFRQVYTELAKNNYLMERDAIPIAPAAHYTIGGITTNLWGRSSVPSLYACGETAATGVHGANRLASNSLLEGIVFGRRIAKCINGDSLAKGKVSGLHTGAAKATGGFKDLNTLRTRLDQVAGVVRNGRELALMLKWLDDSDQNPDTGSQNIHNYHTYNAHQLVKLLLEAALLREESRGGHYRSDFPEKNDRDFEKHIRQQWGRKAVI